MSSHLLSLVPRHGMAQSVSGGLFPSLGRLVEAPFDWLDRVRDRQHLAAMSDAMLKDIGVSRADATHEAEKPFWQA